MLGQFSTELLTLYPGANILADGGGPVMARCGPEVDLTSA